MRSAEIEAWVLSVVERAVEGRPNEDSRVELKSEWPIAGKAARRIAGHANAARADSILWVIGVDEKRHTVVPLPLHELASWWAGVARWFDGLPPDVTELVVPTPSGTVVGVLFGTGRPPYVVTNPEYAITKGEVEREVPWRALTAVRSAYRHELLTLLVPVTALPDVEFQDAAVRFKLGRSVSGDPEGPVVDWEIDAWLYVTSGSRDRVVVPFHRSELSIEVPGSVPRLTAPELWLGPADQPGGPRGSTTITSGATETMIDGPGTLRAHASFSTRWYPTPSQTTLVLKVSFHPVGAVRPASVEAVLTPRGDNTWGFREPRRSRRGEGGVYFPPFVE